MRDAWNHNTQYYGDILRAAPPRCALALDVGCGTGVLARQLADCCDEVVGIDRDKAALCLAMSVEPHVGNLRFVEGDVMNYPFPEKSFDLIAAVATLHHLPLAESFVRLSNLLKPNGVLAVIGLYRAQTLADHLWNAAAVPVSRAMRLLHGWADVGAPTQPPAESLATIHAIAQAQLPGMILKRHLLFRYSIVWRKPYTEAVTPAGGLLHPCMKAHCSTCGDAVNLLNAQARSSVG
jgi:SAM-dependent methyltransferase